MIRVGIITQARTGSTRLPGKILREAGGRTFLDHHLDRLLRTPFPTYVATTTGAADDAIADLAEARGVGVHRGSEEDVLARFAGCAQEFDLEVVVRVTSDCPLIDPEVLTDCVAAYLDAGDPELYVSNTLERSFPRGFDVEVFGAPLLLEAAERADRPGDREHVTPFIHSPPEGRRPRLSVRAPQDRAAYRVTLDTAEDELLLRTLIEQHHAERLTCAEITAVLDAHPELVALTADVEQKKVGD